MKTVLLSSRFTFGIPDFSCRKTLFVLLSWCGLTSPATAQTKIWDRTFSGTLEFSEEYDDPVGSVSIFHAMVATPDGGYLLGGYSRSGSGGDKSEASRGSGFFNFPLIGVM